MKDRIEEVRRLQACMNDLVSLLALPALWTGQDPPTIMATLLDVVVRILRLDFAYARLNVAANDVPHEAVRVVPAEQATPQPKDIGRALEPWLRLNRPGTVFVVPYPSGEGTLSITYLWLGLEKERGVVAAGSARTDFPNDIETLLLKTAVNQAVVELQRAEVVAARDRAEESERLRHRLHEQYTYLREETDQDWGEIVGSSKALKKVLKLVELVAPTTACVLIQGETGTGKELIARAVHRQSERREQAFVKLNCAAIPTGLLEAELFGHEKGAFTGAIAQRIGRFELANHGTIFLDEVGEIPLELQTKLLRVLQEHEFERLGSTRTVQVNVRLVAATNRDLEQMVADREFRSDLYYRLKVFPITVPPLRERPEDIPLLARHFTAHHARLCGKSIVSIPSETVTALCRYPWPGNVREMENLIERSVILSQGPTLDIPLVEFELKPSDGGKPPGSKGLTVNTLEDAERDHILRALNGCDWVIAGPKGAAASLGMKRTSLQYKMQKLGIVRPH